MLYEDLEFEWDPLKARSNLLKHGVSFPFATLIFENERIESRDDREDYGEDRYISLGRVRTDVFEVVYTWRGEKLVRMISARRAGFDEE